MDGVRPNRDWAEPPVDDKIKRAFGLDKKCKSRTIADIKVIVSKITRCLGKTLPIPLCVPFLTKEVGAHVVIDSNNTLGAAVEESDELRTDEPTRPGDEYFHVPLLCLLMSTLKVPQ
jgi:hypothetical protein